MSGIQPLSSVPPAVATVAAVAAATPVLQFPAACIAASQAFASNQDGTSAPPLPPWRPLPKERAFEEDGTPRRRTKNDPLRVFLLSDYPLPLGELGRTSASAEKIYEAAEALHSVGHEVVVIAPGYEARPELGPEAPFPIRTMLFRPGHPLLSREWKKSGPHLGFDYPQIDRNPNLASRFLLSQMSPQQFDQLLMGSLLMFRMTALTFGEPDVVVTSHVASFWNYVAGNYPIRAFTSENDMIPENADPLVRRILHEGAERVGGVFAFSGYAASRVLPNFGIDAPIQRIRRGINPSLFPRGLGLTKADMLARFSPHLSGVSPEARWVVLYDQVNNPDVAASLRHIAQEIVKQQPGTFCLIVQGGTSDPSAGKGDSSQGQVRTIAIPDRRDHRRLLSVADAALVYVGTDVPPRTKDRLERHIEMNGQLAVVLGPDGDRKVFFPGRVDTFAEPVIATAEQVFNSYNAEVDRHLRSRVLNHIRGQSGRERWEKPKGRRSGTIERHAHHAVNRAAFTYSLQRLVNAVGGSVPPEVQAVVPEEWQTPFSVPSSVGLLKYLEPELYRAAMEDEVRPATLVYTAGEHRLRRKQRLDNIVPHDETAMMFEALATEIREGRPLGPAFREWQDWALRAVYTSSFEHPSVWDAIPKPHVNPNGVLSTLARLSGVSTQALISWLRSVQQAPAIELLPPVDEHYPSVPPSDAGERAPIVQLPRRWWDQGDE